jgi:4-diphosphocytidyl-2-C-methyl-D-erythritol kinase
MPAPKSAASRSPGLDTDLGICREASKLLDPRPGDLVFYSPAKINLFFRVLRKRSDGFHEIASLYQAIDLFDRISFSKSEADSLTCSDPQLSCGGDNLIVKALNLFRSHYPVPCGINIHLEKRIPMQAGLGGGSGNAATTLWGLNEWAGRPANLDQLITMGASLGSDVAFFFSHGTAYCTGRGEILEPFTLPRSLEGWLAKPPFGLSTPLVYRETRIEELTDRDPKEILAGYPLFYNDLEPAAFRLEPRLDSFRKQLEQMGFESVTMTGSGTAFFCIGGSRPNSIEMTPFRSIQRDADAWFLPRF